MEKFNVVKRWNINGHQYQAFHSVQRGVSIHEAEWQLENARDCESMVIGNDCDQVCDYDNSLYGKFEMTCNGVKFTFEIEEAKEEKPERKKIHIIKPQLN